MFTTKNDVIMALKITKEEARDAMRPVCQMCLDGGLSLVVKTRHGDEIAGFMFMAQISPFMSKEEPEPKCSDKYKPLRTVGKALFVDNSLKFGMGSLVQGKSLCIFYQCTAQK